MAKKRRPRKAVTRKATDKDTVDTKESNDEETVQPIGDNMALLRRQLMIAHATYATP